MRNRFLSVLWMMGIVFALASCADKAKQQTTIPDEVTLSKAVLLDKIKGGWAGQTIACTYGGPTEFRYQGTMIQDYIPIYWPKGQIKHYYDRSPGLYDDVYMDLTFVDVFDRLGLDAPVDSFAVAFANAPYPLWHANQAARYNILNGIMPPESGSWKYSAHADDIDYQIEADYAGLMSPGMPNTASQFSDKIGHIMNSGNGWYGGVYVGAMYSMAFLSDDVEFVVEEALKVIPEETRYYKCMADVIKWYHQYPDDWKQTWALIEKYYSEDFGCPEGVFNPLNIDALINSAYVVVGLLYGKGDFSRTIDIATRCGQDSDCNPATAGGILGTIIGYDAIPEYWKENIYEVEDRDFKYTNISLNKVYQMSFNQALQVIEREGGQVLEDKVVIKTQRPQPVAVEESFPNMYPVKRIDFRKQVSDWEEATFEGTGIALDCSVKAERSDYVAVVEVYIDGQLDATRKLPALSHDRALEIYYNPMLKKGVHKLMLKWINPEKGASVYCASSIVYSDTPYVNPFK